MQTFLSSLNPKILRDRRAWAVCLLLGMGVTALLDWEILFSFTDARPLRPQDLAATAVFGALFLAAAALQDTKSDRVLCGIFAAVFGICQWIGAVFSHSETWDAFIHGKAKLLKGLAFAGAWFILALAAVRLIAALVRHAPAFSAEQEEAPKWDGPFAKRLRIPFFWRVMLLLLLCWLPYYLIFFPGIMHDDFFMQVMQLFHLPTRFQGRQVTDGINILYSNDHPFLYTQLVGLFLRPAIRIGKANSGIALYSFLQMAGCAAAFSGLLTTLRRFGTSRAMLKAALLVWAVFPSYPMFSFLIGADAFYSILFAVFMICLIRIYGTGGAALERPLFLAGAACAIFAMSAAKSQGVYIAAFMFPVILLTYRRHWKQILLLFLVPLLFYHYVYTGAIFDRCRVAPAGRQEGLSFFFQQTARYVKYSGDDVSGQEKEAIAAILNYDKLADRYNPSLSDPVKVTFNADASDEEMRAYFSAWLRMGLRHPDIYVQSFLANTWGYYTVNFGEYKNNMFFTLNNLKTYQKERPWVQDLIDDGTISPDLVRQLSYTPPAALSRLRGWAKTLLGLTRNVPVLNLTQPTGAVIWLTLLGLLLLLLRRDWRGLMTFLPVFLCFGVCLLSPKNSNIRYTMPDCMMLPGLLAAAAGHLSGGFASASEKTGDDMTAGPAGQSPVRN